MGQKKPRSPFDRYMNALTRFLCRPVDFIAYIDVDFTHIQKKRKAANQVGYRISIAAITAKAVSIGFSRFPLLIQVPSNAAYFQPDEIRLAIPVDSNVSDAYAIPITFINAHQIPLSVLSKQLTDKINAIKSGDIGPFSFLLKIPSWTPVWPIATILAIAAMCSKSINKITFGVPVLTISPFLKEFSLTTTTGGPIIALGAISETASYHEGQPTKTLVGKFSCSVDHRTANARYVGHFLEQVRRAIEIELVEEIESIINSKINTS